MTQLDPAPSSSSPLHSTLLDVEPPGSPNATLLDAVPPSSPNATLLDAAHPGSPNATLLDAAHPSSPIATLLDAAHPNPLNSTLMGVSAPLASSTGAASTVFSTPSRLYSLNAPPMYGAAPSASNPEYPTPSSLPTPVPRSSPNPVQNQPAFNSWNQAGPYGRAPSMPESRVPWPLILVIVVAAAIGVGAVWIWMGTHGGHRAPEDATIDRAPAALPVSDAESINANAAPQGAPPGTAAVDADSGPEDAPE